MAFVKSLSVPFILATLLAFNGCSLTKKGGNGEGTDSDGSGNGITLELNGDSDAGKAGGLRTVYFDFDSANLSGEARSTLEQNAAFLKANPKVSVQIEGHADERGGVQYNLALGEKRAKVVRSHLTGLGVEGGRMTTISFGKERPVAFGHDEDAWGKNRRGNFVVTAK